MGSLDRATMAALELMMQRVMTAGQAQGETGSQQQYV